MAEKPRFSCKDGVCTLAFPDRTVLEQTDRQWSAAGMASDFIRALGPEGLINEKRLRLDMQQDCDAFVRACAQMNGMRPEQWQVRLVLLVRVLRERMPEAPLSPAPPGPAWPVLDEAAYYGLAGDMVHTITPHSESDPVALLVQSVVMFGNAIGRTPYFPVEADRHYLNLFACLVGQTSRARKGTSAGHPRRVLSALDDAWSLRIMGGLSSGEGVIWHVRDKVTGTNKKGSPVVIDAGVEDKRLMVLETEFARALAKTGQEGNVLSAVLRQAWDHGDLRTLVSGRSKAPVSATGAHVSMIAHITAEELRRVLVETEAANGFGNRFLWVCVKRAQLLPEGGLFPAEALRPLEDRLKKALFAARQAGRMQRSPAAKARWAEMYTEMADGAPGLLGALTARAEAQVLRLSCLYTLLAQHVTVDVPHLEAAYALWRYCEASARYIFGASLGEPLADDLLRLLRQAGAQGMTRTDIYNALGRNVRSRDIAQALALLQRGGHAQATSAPTSGRPLERWQAISRGIGQHAFNAFNAQSGGLNALNALNASEEIF